MSWRGVGLACALALLAGLSPGCGFGAMQTARPTPRGALDLTASTGFVYNDTLKERGVAFSNFPMGFSTRLGLTERTDLGLKLFYLAGLEADIKVNMLPPSSPWALSLRMGLGGAKDLVEQGNAGFVHIPVVLAVSYDFAFGLTPYLHVGYELYWIMGREPKDTDLVDYVERKGYGDHLLTVRAGLQYRINRIVSLLAEYGYWHPVVDDPGDGFSFLDNHMVMIGVAFRVGLWGAARRAMRRKPPRTPPAHTPPPKAPAHTPPLKAPAQTPPPMPPAQTPPPKAPART